ncbi:Sec-independent protein translocase subunit TatA [Streptomyces sp. NPDC055722]
MLENRTLEIIIIAAVVLLLFGAKRLPDTARGLGKSLRIFKSEVSAMKTDSAQATPAAPKSVAAGPIEDATSHPVTQPTSIIQS